MARCYFALGIDKEAGRDACNAIVSCGIAVEICKHHKCKVVVLCRLPILLTKT